MLTKRAGEFEARCDVCGRKETLYAHSFADAWHELKFKAWAVRRKASPIIHVCPECPVDVAQKKAPSR
jgi:hypothetical protein